MNLLSADGDPVKLDRAARQLDQLAKRLKEVSTDLHAFQRKIGPLADDLNAAVGGSSTRRDVQIGKSINDTSSALTASADNTSAAFAQAKEAAGRAHQQAQAARKKQGQRNASPTHRRA